MKLLNVYRLSGKISYTLLQMQMVDSVEHDQEFEPLCRKRQKSTFRYSFTVKERDFNRRKIAFRNWRYGSFQICRLEFLCQEWVRLIFYLHSFSAQMNCIPQNNRSLQTWKTSRPDAEVCACCMFLQTYLVCVGRFHPFIGHEGP